MSEGHVWWPLILILVLSQCCLVPRALSASAVPFVLRGMVPPCSCCWNAVLHLNPSTATLEANGLREEWEKGA